MAIENFEFHFGHTKSSQHHCNPCVSADDNINLTPAQKELLLWHWKLGISMHRIQELMCRQRSVQADGTQTWMPPVVKTRNPRAASCPVPCSETFEIARAKKRNPKVVEKEALKEKEAILAWDKYQPGDFVSMDQFVCHTPGRLMEGFWT